MGYAKWDGEFEFFSMNMRCGWIDVIRVIGMIENMDRVE